MRKSDVIKPWWEEPEGEAHEAIKHLVDHLQSRDEKGRRTNNLRYMALYGDRRARDKVARRTDAPHLKFNLTKAVVDAAQAEIAGMRPKPSFLTQRGDWGLKRRAQACELMVEAEYEAHAGYEPAARGFLAAAKTSI